jgi:putative spermidine/putrescine transport system substrate-binding protein
MIKAILTSFRRIHKGLLYCGLLPVVLFAPASQAQNELTFVSWGGAYTRSQMLAFVRPYQSATETRITVEDYNGGLDELRNQVRSLNFKWDVIDLELSDAIRGCEEGLLEKIDPASLKASQNNQPITDDFIAGSLAECAIGTVIWSTVIAYNPVAFSDEQPDSLEDFFDTARFPGRRGLRRTPKANLEWALLADGVPQPLVYDVLATEAGLSRALRKLNEIKPQLVWWQAGIDAPRLLETGRVVMTSAYNGRIEAATGDRNQPFAMIWDHQIWNIDLLGIPKDNPRGLAALDFIRFATASEQLAEQARHIPYGPVRRSSMAHLSREERANLPTQSSNFASALQIDARWWAEHYEAINNRFEEWLQQPVAVPKRLPR